MRRGLQWAGALGAALAAATAAADSPLPQEDCAGVYWDLTALFESGDRVYARVLVTNEGPGEHNAVGLGHWIDPQGRVTEFQNGRRRGRWQLEAEGRRVRIGSTLLDRSEPVRRFEVDNDKRGVKIHLALGPEGILEREALSGDYAVAVEALGAPVSGSAWRRGMETPKTLRGRASLVRTRHTECERELSARRLDLHAQPARSPEGAEEGAERAALLLVHHTAPDGASRAWLGWRRAEGSLRATEDLRVELSAAPSPDSDYALPSSLRWSGPELSGKAVLESPHLSIDPLDALPRLVQMLYSLWSRPLRTWSDAGELKLARELARNGLENGLKAAPGSAVLRTGAPAVVSTTFLRPLGD